LSFFHQLLGLKKPQDEASSDPRAIRSITAQLEDLPPEEARYLAAFAYVLARTAYADMEVSPDEVAAMKEIVQEETDLDRHQAALVVELATSQASTVGGTQDFVVTKLLGELATPKQRRQVLDCALAVAAADDVIVGAEEHEIRKIARALGITDQDFLAALSRYRDKRSVMKDWPGA